MEGSLTPLAQIAGTLSVPQGVIAPTLQDKTVDITATETAQTETVEKDQGYDGLNEVTINVSAIPSDYVGSGIDRRDETDLTASGATVTVPAGYYEEAETKSIESGAAATPATSITANPSISLNTETGLITATASASQNVTPNVTPGYVDSGTAGAISVSGSSTSQLSVQAGSTITPTESQQTAVAAGKYTIGAVNIGAISSSYVGSGITRRDSDDLTASGATVTAPAGYYGESASKSVASGTEGTPTATKGSVSNHSVSVTPSVTNTAGYISGGTKTGTAVTVSASELVSGSQTIDVNDTYDVTNLSSVTVNVPTGSTINNQDKSVTPTESAQSVTYDSGYTGLGTVSVGAISSSYVGTGITRRDSDDLSASGATVSAPAGYYGSAASKTIASGTEGTPTATKGNVSNHAISVTPSVTNAAGYISGGTHAGTAVSVSASELVSGTLTVDSSGTKDVTNYASASVPAGTAGTPTATKGTVSNHSVTVTPSVTNSAGWVGSETKTGTAVTVQASELVSGSQTIQTNDTYDVTNLASVTVNVSGGVDTELQSYLERTATTVNNSSLTKLGASSFRAYSGLTSAIFQNVTTCGGQTFYASTSLTSLELPSLTAVPNEMCRGCTNLTSVSIPNVSGTLPNAAFRETKLSIFVTPSGITRIDTLALGSCSSMTTIDMNKVTSLGNSAFQSDSNLNLLIMRHSGIVSIPSTNVIQGSKFANGGAGGDIYILKSLYDHLGDNSNMDYKEATNWSTIDGYGTITWHAIEGSYYETHYADGTLIPTT